MNVTKSELESLIEKLQACVDEMESVGVESIPTSCSTYRMNKFISFGYNGYLSLDNDYIEVSGDDDEE